MKIFETDIDEFSFVLGVVIVLIIVMLWKKKDYFTNNELKAAIDKAATYDWDYIKFVANIGSTDVSPLDYARLLGIYKKNKWTNENVSMILSGKGYLVE